MNAQLENLTEIAGWIGVLLILLAYGLLSFGYLEPVSIEYQLLNFFGGIGIIIDAIADKNYQPAVLNVIWSAIALIAMAQILR
ncbi:hypothetical protein HQ487_05120 [Candidatus Uhrbacteria bacterium]|nr:hypothetical protein [Candidatus Uhrbacteria bacterium]